MQRARPEDEEADQLRSPTVAILAQAVSCSKSICDLFTEGEVGLWSLVVVCAVAIPATVFPSCLCGLAALVSRKVFWLVMGNDGSQTKEEVMGVGPGQGRKGSGRNYHNRWQKGVDVQILFGVECVDVMALQAMLS